MLPVLFSACGHFRKLHVPPAVKSFQDKSVTGSGKVYTELFMRWQMMFWS